MHWFLLIDDYIFFLFLNFSVSYGWIHNVSAERVLWGEHIQDVQLGLKLDVILYMTLNYFFKLFLLKTLIQDHMYLALLLGEHLRKE